MIDHHIIQPVKAGIAILFLLVLSASCTKDPSNDAAPEKLQAKGLSASSAIVNDVITIYGAGFSEVPDENAVIVAGVFDTARATIIAASKNQLKIRIPWTSKAGENIIRVTVKDQVINYNIYIYYMLFATISHDFSDPTHAVNRLYIDQRLSFLTDRSYALPIDNDSCENIIYYPPTSEFIGITVKNKMIKYNIITKKIDQLTLPYPANVYLEGVVRANDTLYAFKKGNSIKQLVTIDVNTGKEMTAVDINMPGNSFHSPVYYAQSNEIIGLSEDFKQLIRYNVSTRKINTVVLSTEKHIDYMALVVKESTLRAYKRTSANPPLSTAEYYHLGTLDPVSGRFAMEFNLYPVEENLTNLFYLDKMLYGTDRNTVYQYEPNGLMTGTALAKSLTVSFSGAITNDLSGE